MIFLPFVTRVKQSQKFLSPSNPDFIGYMLYTSPSFSAVFISLHKMTRWWQSYLWLYGENVAWEYWLLVLYISQRIYRQRTRVYNDSVSTRSALSDNSFRDLPYVCNKDISIKRADRICFSQTSPIWLDAVRFMCQLM